MKLAKKAGLKNNFVSNGFMSEESARLVIPYLDAINIDIRGFSEEFYQKVCGGRLKPVLDTCKLMKKSGVWIEITTLVIPTLSDSEEIGEIAERMEKEGKTIEGYQRIIELTQKIQKIYQEKEGPELLLFWDWKTKEKFLVDWQKDYIEKFNMEPSYFSPDGEKIAAWVKDKQGETIAVNGQAWEERFDLSFTNFSASSTCWAWCIQKTPLYYGVIAQKMLLFLFLAKCLHSEYK
jgi:nucleoside diphosphate kinase